MSGGMEGGDFLADARGEGWRAAGANWPRASNPYPRGGQLRDHWDAGWQANVNGASYTETVRQRSSINPAPSPLPST